MTKQVQLRRGSSAEHSVFTGALAELTVDTSKNVAIVHDGVTPGGWPLVGTAATQQIINKSGVGIGTSSLTKQFQVVGDTDIQGNINARSLTVVYQGPVTRSGIISATPNTRILGIATNNIRVGYAVTGTYIDPTTTVTSLGLGTVFISPSTIDFSITAVGNFLTNNGTVLVGISTLFNTPASLLTVGDSISGINILNNTSITALSTSSNGTVTISQSSSNTLGITTRSGTSAGIGATTITGVTTTSLQIGDNVDYTGGIVGITTIYSIGVNNVVTNTGLNTSGATSFTFTRPVTVVMSSTGFTTHFSFTDILSGQINVDVLNANNFAAVELTANTATISNAGITTAGITSATITNANIINETVTNSRVSGVSTISTLYTNVGIGTTISSVGLSASNLYFNSGIGSQLYVTGVSTASNLYVDSGIFTNVSISTATVNNGIFTNVSISTATVNNGIFTNVSISGVSTVNETRITNAGISTATIQNAYIQSGIVTNLTSTNTNITGVGTILSLNATYSNTTGISTISTLYVTDNAFISTATANIGIFTNVSISGVATVNIGKIIVAGITSIAYIQSGIVTNLTSTNTNIETGIASTLYVNNGIFTTASINQVTVNNGIFTTTSIGTVTANNGIFTTVSINEVTSNSGIFTNVSVSGVSTISTLYANVGIGTTISSVGLAASALYFNSGIGTQLYVTGIATLNSSTLVNSRVSGILTVGVSSIVLSGNDATISGVTTLSTNQLNVSNRIVASDKLSFTYTGTLSIAGTSIITGVSTLGVYSSYAVTGTNIPANAYVLSVGTSSITLNSPALNAGIQTTSFTFTDGTTGLSTIPNLIGSNIQYTGISTFAQALIASGNISSVTSSNLDMTNAGVASIATLKVQTGIITNLTGTNVKYTGISTFGNVVIGGATTDLIVTGNARITGVLTIGTASITLDPENSNISGLNSIRSSSGYVTNFYSNQVGINSTLNFIGVNSNTGLNQTVTFNLSKVGIATNYTLTLPPTAGKDGQVLAVDGSGNLGFTTNPGGLYENRLYVSATNGSDTNDGKTKPVRSVKKAAQLASFESFVLPPGRFLDAADLLTKNRTFIQEEVVGFLTATYPGITTDANYYRDVCYRDVGYIVDALAYDLSYNGNSKSVGAGLSYYSGVGTSYVDGEKIQTIDSFTHIVDISKYIINNVPLADPGGRYDDASRLLILNKNYIAAEAVGYVTAIYPGLLSNPTYSGTKCLRDVGYIVDALAYDVKYGGNYKSVGAGVSYWSGLGTSYVTGEQVETVASFRYIAGISSYIINNITVPVSYQVGVGSTAQVKDLSIAYDVSANPVGYATTGCANVRSNINTLVGIITTIVGQGVTYAPSITRPVGLYQTSVYQTYDFTIAYDDSVNPVGYATTGCANVLSSIATLVGVITSIIGIGSTAAPTIVSPTSKSNPIAIICEAGEYLEDNPIILYEDIAIIGDNLRNTIIRPQNAGKDLLRVRNGCYVTGFAMKDYADAAGVPQYTFDYAVAFDDPLDTSVSRTGYAVKTTKPSITRSPYIQNCSIISFLGANGILVDGSKVFSPNQSIIPEEGENPVAGSQPEFGKSMVAATFTMTSFGGIGWRTINDGYAQVVSCFQIFCKYGSLCQSGGYLSITNSATNFGLYALRSQGYSSNSFRFDRGRIALTGTSGGLQTLTVIGLGRINQDLYVLRFFDDNLSDRTSNFKPLTVTLEVNAATAVNTSLDTITSLAHPFSAGDSVIYYGDEQALPQRIIGGLVNGNQYYISYINSNTFKLTEDDSLTRVVDLTSSTTGINTFVKNNQDFFNKTVLSTHNNYQTLTLAGVGSTAKFVSGRQITQTVVGGTAVGFAYTYNNSTRQLVVSVESSGGNLRFFQISNGTTNLNIIDHSPSPISIGVSNVAGLSTYYTTYFKVDSTNSGTVITGISSLPENYRCHFHRPSIINANSHAWEYAGSGTDYNALPQNGGLSIDGREQVGEFGGRVYSTGTNELGDFKVGNFITAYNRTGNIIFNNTVTIGTLDSLRLSLSGGTAITEFSIDAGLGDNEISGPQDYRVSTQLATRSFLNNRLGSFIDKNLTTNAVPGGVVQLNSIGQINADLIPPKAVNYFKSSTDGGRIYLVNTIPATNLLSGDTVIEPSNSWVMISDLYGQYLILDNNTVYNFANGSVVTSTVSAGGAIGVVTAPTYVGYGTTGLVRGVGLSLNTLIGGSGYLVAGIYTGIQLDSASGIGTSMTATITVSAAGTVSNVAINTGGRYYAVNDTLTLNNPASIGGRTGGSNFTTKIGSVETRLYLSLTNNNKFTGSASLPDYIQDGNAGSISTSISVGVALTSTFSPTDVSIGGNVDFVNDRIVIGINTFSDGDPVVYSTQGGNVLTPLLDVETYYIKRVGVTSVELYTTYALVTKKDYTSSGTGTHKLTRVGVNTDTNQLTFANHGLSQGDPVKVSGNTPTGVTTGNYYYIGSRTTNTFTLHSIKADAILSVNGLLYNPVDLTSANSDGTMTLTKQNVTYTSTVNTSSSILSNWALLATSTIDAANVVSGILVPSRLASGTANNQTFLRGDSTWSKAVSSVGIGTTQPIGVTYSSADLASGGVGINTYYGNVQLTLNRVLATGDLYSTLGVAKFKSSTFGITGDGTGSVYIKTLSQGGDIDAATFNGNAASYYLDIANTSGNIPISRGGTGLSGLPSNGAILIGNGSVYNLTTTPTFVGSVSFNSGASGAVTVGANGDIVLTTGGTWSGEKGYKLQAYNSNFYLQYTGSIFFRNQSSTNIFNVDQNGNATASGTVTGTQLISNIAQGTSPLTVISTTLVSNLNANYLNGYATATANTVNSVVLRDASGNFSAGTITATLSGNASSATTHVVTDSRGTTTTPQTINMGVVFDFKQNTTESLSDGGTYFGEMTFRQYGSSTDWSGGLSHQLGFTDNGNIWQRSGSNTTWGSWKKLLDSNNYGGYSTFSGTVQGTTFTSTVSTGTAPLTVTSTTQVNNLNAQYLNGSSSATANTGSTIVLRDSSGNFSAGTITATFSGGLSGSVTGGTISATTGTLSGNLSAWNTATPGTGVGGLHLGAASATSNVGPAITFGARDASSGTGQAGIYINSDGTYGTRMYFATTDSYATGSKVAMSINEFGAVTLSRSGLTAASGTISGSILASTVATGTAPLTVTSTTQVSNLNVSQLEGFTTDTANTANRIVRRDASGNFSAATITATRFQNSSDNNTRLVNGELFLRSASPTIYLRDTDHNVSMIHCNSNTFYVLRGATDSETWTQVNSVWPLQIDLTNNNATFGGTVTASSDVRFKKNIKTIQDALDKVLNMRGVTFERLETPGTEIGVIAQEVEKVVPEVVTTDSKGHKSVAYSNMVAVLIEAIKEQQIQIDTLRKEVEDLKNK